MRTFFQLDKNIAHLNHAAVGPWPQLTRDAVIAFAEENASVGSQRYDLWLKREQQLKQKLAKLINASSTDEIALLKNTSEGLSLVAQGLTFRPGDNIVVPEEEFPFNMLPWLSLRGQGVEVRCIPIQGVSNPEQALLAAMDDHTRLLSCSSVQYAHGLRLDLDMIGHACKQNNTLFCVDAIQSLGALEFDARHCHADFVVADGHKWLCASEGTALFYCRRDVQPLLQLRQHGWHMLKNPYQFNDWHNSLELADGAQRFECGSSNMMGITALNASLGMLLDIGINKIQQQVISNTEYLFEQLRKQPDIKILTPQTEGKYAGIVTFQKPAVDNDKLYRHLQANDVLCACRGGGIRFSPHFYTEKARIDRALDLVFGFY
jgi:selenocysteine lyase/cysteine desulfurase